MSGYPQFDPKAFRVALGAFTTGVTIITARAADGTPVGLTANSFNSVSLEPPMVLWSLAKTARSLEVFSSAEHWTVHILASDQEDLSNRFASRGEDKFQGLELEQGVSGTPMLKCCLARFQCRNSFQYEGGDHIIFVGEVVDFDRAERAPLVFQAGKYALSAAKGGGVSLSTAGQAPGSSFGEDFLGYLLGRSHYQILDRVREQRAIYNLTDAEFFVLSVLSVRDGRRAQEISALVSYTGVEWNESLLAGLLDRALLRTERQADEDELLYLTETGRDAALRIIAAGKAIESDLLGKLGLAEGELLKKLLKQLILQTDPGVPDLWAQAGWGEDQRAVVE